MASNTGSSKRAFNSGQFNFRETALSESLRASGATATITGGQGQQAFFVREPKAMFVRADGKRELF